MSVQGLKRERRVRLGSVDLKVAVPLDVADRVRGHPVYRNVVKPTMVGLGRLNQLRRSHSNGNGHARGNGAGGYDPDYSNDPLPPVPPVPPAPADLDRQGRKIIEKIAGQEWYHSIDLGHGVITPGFVDHRDQLPYYGLPASLAGKRVLDVATFDGFWAFEFARRGAEVVAADIPRWTDVDVPRILLPHADVVGLDRATGSGFRLANEIVKAPVERIECSVYDLDPAKVGMFDVVFISDLLVHLRDPQLALDRARSVCRGEVVVADVYTPKLEALGDHALAWFTAPGETWWLPNIATLEAMMREAGFTSIAEVSRFALQARADDMIHKVVLRGEVADDESGRSTRRAHTPVLTAVSSNGAGASDPPLRKQRTVHAGRLDFTVSMPLELAGRIGSNALYQLVRRRGVPARPRAEVAHGRERPPLRPITAEARRLWERVGEVDWTHSIDLGLGVVTPGEVDLRDHVAFYGLPESLAGRRVLDLGTGDGFWAFEFERRGGEVIALDLVDEDYDKSAARRHQVSAPSASSGGFALAAEVLGSSARPMTASVYGLDPEILGTFDVVFMSDLLSRLRCPMRALESAAAVCHGEIVVGDVFTPTLESVGDLALAEYGAPNHTWWLPNVRTLANMMIVAGCEPVDEVARFVSNAGTSAPTHRVVLRGQVRSDPIWLQQWRQTAQKTPPKWRSASERAE